MKKGRPEESFEVPKLVQAAARIGLSLPGVAFGAASAAPLIHRALNSSLGLQPEAPAPFDPEWLPNGEVRFAATPDSGLNIALDQDQDLHLCAVGSGDVACGVARVNATGSVDRTLIRQSPLNKIVAELIEVDQSVHLAEARALAVAKALRSLGVSKGASVQFRKIDKLGMLFTVSDGGKDHSILSVSYRKPGSKDEVIVAVLAHAVPCVHKVEEFARAA